MALRSEPTSQSLEKKLLMMGFEIPDVLAIFLLLSILNFSFGQNSNKFLCVWLPTLITALVLRISKNGKPDNYLVHLGKFHFSPKYLSAFSDPKNSTPPPNFKGSK